LNIDLINPSRGPGARVAVELEPSAARALAEGILQTLETVPPELMNANGSSEGGMRV
jgi:hypothetical protein